MFDHITLNTGTLSKSKPFYMAILKPLGYKLVSSGEDHAGFEYRGHIDFWLALRKPLSTNVHIAFKANTSAEVDSFHMAGLKAGGIDNGKPGLRPDYAENYYGAFILDPDGNNIEAVCYI